MFVNLRVVDDFYPRSPCGERRGAQPNWNTIRLFLSTLSLRRATKAIKIRINLIDNFYPRSPCGERLLWVLRKVPILDFYPRSPCGERPSGGGRTGSGSYFYPRSPYGERHDFRG